MGIQINHYDTPRNEFEELKAKYPTGRYAQSHKGARWFSFFISEMDVEFTWFQQRDWRNDNEE